MVGKGGGGVRKVRQGVLWEVLKVANSRICLTTQHLMSLTSKLLNSAAILFNTYFDLKTVILIILLYINILLLLLPFIFWSFA